MAKLYFYYASMNAGKSTTLLQAAHNYSEGGKHTILYTAAVDDRYGVGKIVSRIGLEKDARVFGEITDLYAEVKAHLDDGNACDCVLVDEAQFLSKEQVNRLAMVADLLHVPVICYGLRVDFQGTFFPGSHRLMEIADKFLELKGICRHAGCGKKATMVVRRDGNGVVVTEGAQVHIGGNDSYEALCRTHYMIETGVYPSDIH